MNKNKKVLIIIGFILLILVLVYLKLFVIGSNNYDKIQINKVSIGNEEIIIDGSYTDASKAYKDYKYTLVGTELYVEVTNVFLSKRYNTGIFKIIIPIDGSEINNIHLTDNKTTKVIYSK